VHRARSGAGEIEDFLGKIAKKILQSGDFCVFGHCAPGSANAQQRVYERF
jgi:hypothetical protein